MAGLSPEARGHYERLLHERHRTVGHNSCKGATTESDRKLLLRCPFCALNATSADNTYDHIFWSCQHPLLTIARLDSNSCLCLLPLSTDLDRHLLPELLLLLASEDGHGICLGNWSSFQILQLDLVLQPTDTVPALNESLLALSKHLVNRIDNIWAVRQQARYLQALTTTPEADPGPSELFRDASPLVSPPWYPSSFLCRPARSCPWHLHVLEGGAAPDCRHSHGLQEIHLSSKSGGQHSHDLRAGKPPSRRPSLFPFHRRLCPAQSHSGLAIAHHLSGEDGNQRPLGTCRDVGEDPQLGGCLCRHQQHGRTEWNVPRP